MGTVHVKGKEDDIKEVKGTEPKDLFKDDTFFLQKQVRLGDGRIINSNQMESIRRDLIFFLKEYEGFPDPLMKQELLKMRHGYKWFPSRKRTKNVHKHPERAYKFQDWIKCLHESKTRDLFIELYDDVRKARILSREQRCVDYARDMAGCKLSLNHYRDSLQSLLLQKQVSYYRYGIMGREGTVFIPQADGKCHVYLSNPQDIANIVNVEIRIPMQLPLWTKSDVLKYVGEDVSFLG